MTGQKREGGPQSWYELRDLLEAGDFAKASEVLTREPSLRDARNGLGETVLHFFAVENNLAAIEWLHARGFDLNARNEFGNPWLFEVALLGYRDLFIWLIEHGADAKQKTREGEGLEEFLREAGEDEMLAFVKKHLSQ